MPVGHKRVQEVKQRTLGHCFITTATWMVYRWSLLNTLLNHASKFYLYVWEIFFPTVCYETNSPPSANLSVRWLLTQQKVVEKNEAPITILLPFKHQKSTTEYADNSQTLVGRSVQLSSRWTQVERTGMKSKWGKTSHPLWINNICVYHFQCNLFVIGYVGCTCQHLLAVNWRTQGICNRKSAERSARYYVPWWHCTNVNKVELLSILVSNWSINCTEAVTVEDFSLKPNFFEEIK